MEGRGRSAFAMGGFGLPRDVQHQLGHLDCKPESGQFEELLTVQSRSWQWNQNLRPKVGGFDVQENIFLSLKANVLL